MEIYLNGHIRNSKTLALRIQQAFLNNDNIHGSPGAASFKNLPVPIIKILFQKGWLCDDWQHLPYYAPWEELDIEHSPLDYYDVERLLERNDFQEKVRKTPMIHIANYIKNDVPLPEEIPKKIIINQYLYQVLEPSYRAIPETKIIDIIKYINHKETEIEIQRTPNLPDAVIKAVINNIENELLYYFCLKYDLKNIPEPMKKLLLKPIPYDSNDWQKQRIMFLLLNNLAIVHINQQTIAKLFNNDINLNDALFLIKEMDFTNGPIKINL